MRDRNMSPGEIARYRHGEPACRDPGEGSSIRFYDMGA